MKIIIYKKIIENTTRDLDDKSMNIKMKRYYNTVTKKTVNTVVGAKRFCITHRTSEKHT